MISQLSSYLNSFFDLFYPNLCLACFENKPSVYGILCRTCDYKLERTDFHLHHENLFTERFWGRIPIKQGIAMYYFSKNSKVQRLIHLLKYKGKHKIGIQLGCYYGRVLRSENAISQPIDIIIPVPLHPTKERKRGYNQSALFAEGLGEALNVPWSRDILIREVFTPTQTSKSRIDRFQNVVNAFSLKKPEAIEGKHVLLVDDVITTGATLEACGIKILEIPNTTLSMATIAIAKS